MSETAQNTAGPMQAVATRDGRGRWVAGSTGNPHGQLKNKLQTALIDDLCRSFGGKRQLHPLGRLYIEQAAKLILLSRRQTDPTIAAQTDQ